MFDGTTSRLPTQAELEIMQELLQQNFNDFSNAAENASALLTIGDSAWKQNLNAVELAAWTTVASTILMLDETITRN
jgi:predicted solute-binding protein